MANTDAHSTKFHAVKNDSLRLEKLYEYEILDTHPEDTFDKIAILASQVFDTPNAFITFVDKDRVFFKSNISNFIEDVSPIEKNPFSLSTMKDDFTIYYDTFDDHFLRDSPLVRCSGGIRFYAAAPLKTPEGFLIGTICVADSVPRNNNITSRQVEMLKSLADVIVNNLESRLRYNNLLKVQDELMNITLHEIKNPLATISIASDIWRKDPVKTEKMALMIKQGVTKITNKLNDVLEHSEKKERKPKLSIQDVDLQNVFNSLLKNFELQAKRKNQKITILCIENLPKIPADKKKICDVFHNLLSNALKYSHKNTTITILAKSNNDSVEVEFRDQGLGLDVKDMENLFKKFAKLSARPTGKETSTGLGLFICKSFVEMHNGSIYAESKGRNCGSSFFVRLPLVHLLKEEPVLNSL